MRKVVLYIAVSLDGYIADQMGKVDWLGGDGSWPDCPGSYPEFIKTVDDVILGYKTYYQIATELDPDHWPYEGKNSYVLTHREQENKDGIFFVQTDVSSLVRKLRQTDGKRIWICGGASVVAQALESDNIDEFEIDVMPTILGNGIPLFEPQSAARKLRLMSVSSFDGIVHLCYERKRDN